MPVIDEVWLSNVDHAGNSLLNTGAQVQSQTSTCYIFGTESGSVTCSPLNIIPQMLHTYSFITETAADGIFKSHTKHYSLT
jgi:hypothetical protein